MLGVSGHTHSSFSSFPSFLVYLLSLVSPPPVTGLTMLPSVLLLSLPALAAAHSLLGHSPLALHNRHAALAHRAREAHSRHVARSTAAYESTGIFWNETGWEGACGEVIRLVGP